MNSLFVYSGSLKLQTLQEIKYELYFNGNPYHLHSNIFSAEHVLDIVKHHFNRYAIVKDEIISENGILKIDISHCEQRDPPCIHFESGLHGLSKELEEKIAGMDLFGWQGNL